MCRMFPAARLFTGSLMNHHNDLAIRKLQQLKKGKLFLRWSGTEQKSKQGNEISLRKPNCEVKSIWKLWLWNFILVRVHTAKHPRPCFENEALFIGGISLEWGKRNAMKWDPSLATYWCCSVCSFNQWVHKSLLGIMCCSRYWDIKRKK